MKLLVVVRVDVATGKHLFDMRQELRIDRHHIFEVAVGWTIFDHPDLPVAFDDLSLDFADLLINKDADVLLSAEIASRASITQLGQRESVVRGQPRVGLLFCQDFNSGLSDHFGINEGLGLYLFTD
jgi:hypothetical protein